MSTTANTNTVSDVAAWHAMSQAEVVKRLATNPEKGLNLSEASARLLGQTACRKAGSGAH